MNEQILSLGISELAFQGSAEDGSGHCLDRAIIAQVAKRAAAYRLILKQLDIKAVQEICLHMSPTEQDIICRLLMEQVVMEVQHLDRFHNARYHQRAALLDIIYNITASNIPITAQIRPQLHHACMSLKHRVVQDMLRYMEKKSPVCALRLSL